MDGPAEAAPAECGHTYALQHDAYTECLHPNQSFRMKSVCTLQTEDHHLKVVIDS